MTLEQKMLAIKAKITAHKHYVEKEHRSIGYEEGTVGYYVSDDKYFEIKFESHEVNVCGQVMYPNLGAVLTFSLHKWLGRVAKVMKGKEVTN